MHHRERLINTLKFLPVDCLPDDEFGTWNQTIKRWRNELPSQETRVHRQEITGKVLICLTNPETSNVHGGDMRVVRLHETSIDENTQLIRGMFLGSSVSNCGLAEFVPGMIALENERHLHDQNEVFIILSGEITVPTEGGGGDIARAGDWVFVEAGLEHHLTNHTVLPCVAMYLIIGRNANLS